MANALQRSSIPWRVVNITVFIVFCSSSTVCEGESVFIALAQVFLERQDWHMLMHMQTLLGSVWDDFEVYLVHPALHL